MRLTGFDKWIVKEGVNKVYVGVSAGSVVMGQSIEVASLEPADPNIPGITDLTGIGCANFNIEPHCDELRFNVLETWAESQSTTLYALDDQSAIKIDGDQLDVVSEGNWKKFS